MVLRSFVVSFYFVLTAFTCCLAQPQAEPEQLRQQLKTATHDTARINAYTEIGKYYAKRQYDSAYRYFKIAVDLSREKGTAKHKLRCLSYLALVLKNKGDFTDAVACYRESLPLAKALNNTDAMGALYNNLGNTYQRLGLLDSALACLQMSLALKLSQHDDEGIVNSCINLGNFHATRRNYQEAKRYYRKGLQIESRLNDPVRQAKLYLNLGNAYYEVSRYDSAEICYDHVMQHAGDQVDKKSLYHNLGNIHQQKKNYRRALEFYQMSLALCESSGDVFRAVNSLNNIGNVHKLQNNYSRALATYETALQKAEQIRSADQVRTLRYNIGTCHEKQNDLFAALDQFKKAKAIEDTLYNREKAALLAEMQTRFKTQQQEKELIQQRSENRIKRFERDAFIGASAFLCILLVVALVAYKQKKQANARLAQQKKIIEKREHEKALLLRELHHRSKNNLQLISSLLNLQAHQLTDVKAARAVKEGQARVEAMAIIHRDLYMKDNGTRVNLKQYLEKMLNNLIGTYNFDRASLVLQHDIQEIEVEADFAIPLGLIANELISNAFKHAFPDQQNPALVIVAKEAAEGELEILISDNGKGIGAGTPGEKSFGMTMVHSLVKQMNGRISFDNTAGCAVRVTMPMTRKESLVEA